MENFISCAVRALGTKFEQAKIPKDFYLVEAAKPCYSAVHYLTKRYYIMKFLKVISQGYLRTAPNSCFCLETPR